MDELDSGCRSGPSNRRLDWKLSEKEHLEQQVLQLEQQLRERSERVQGLERQLANVISSRSWRLTEPFRRLMAALRALMRSRMGSAEKMRAALLAPRRGLPNTIRRGIAGITRGTHPDACPPQPGDTIWDHSQEQYILHGFKIYWETLATIRDSQRLSMTGNQEVDFLSWTVAQLKRRTLRDDLRALSIGCLERDPGPEMSLVQSGMFQHVTVMDIAEGLLAKQRDIAQKRRLSGIEYIKQDLNELVLDANSFDLIWAIGTIHHVSNLEGLLSTINGALREKGLFMMREYVGPNRLQFTSAQLSYVNQILASLPSDYKRTADGQLKEYVEPPTIADVIAGDPSESVRSQDIMGVFHQSLRPIKVAYTGGTILHPLLSGIAQNFETLQDGASLLKVLVLFENTLISAGILPSDYVFCLAERKSL